MRVAGEHMIGFSMSLMRRRPGCPVMKKDTIEFNEYYCSFPGHRLAVCVELLS